MTNIKICPRCNGKGYITDNWNKGKCADGGRCVFTKVSGKRSDKCLRCGKDYKDK